MLTGVEVLPRSAWGADESLRVDQAGRVRWPAEFRRPRAIVLHHTKTENDDPLPLATMGRIERYHAVDRGWGDIGYNVVVLQDGRILQGRWSPRPAGEDDSGRTVVGAHALRHNHGSFGIALLGTFHDRPPTDAAWAATRALVAALVERHGIDVAGKAPIRVGVRRDRVVPHALVGHGELGDTTCPGPELLVLVDELRTRLADPVLS